MSISVVSDLPNIDVTQWNVQNISQNVYLFIFIARFWNREGELKMTSSRVNGIVDDFFIFAKVLPL